MYCERDYAKRMPPEKKLVIQELDDSLNETIDRILNDGRKRDEEEHKRRTRNIIICSVIGGMVISLAIWNRSRRG